MDRSYKITKGYPKQSTSEIASSFNPLKTIEVIKIERGPFFK